MLTTAHHKGEARVVAESRPATASPPSIRFPRAATDPHRHRGGGGGGGGRAVTGTAAAVGEWPSVCSTRRRLWTGGGGGSDPHPRMHCDHHSVPRTARRLRYIYPPRTSLPERGEVCLEDVQRRALQVIFGNVPYDEARRTCNILPPAERRHELGKRFFRTIIKDKSNVLFYISSASQARCSTNDSTALC